MVQGIVSLLDSHHYLIVEDLWAELKREFGVQGVYITPYPHFSYQVASHYNVEALELILRDFAPSHKSFYVNTTGLSIFTGKVPVLYIPVVRSAELTRIHQELWQVLSNANLGSEVQAYYHPNAWMPHITIGSGDLDSDILARMVHYLSERDFTWRISIDNITFIYDPGTGQEVKYRFQLIG
jgi:2'-5' RNA ligase